MTRTISILEDGITYRVTGDYCPGCGHAAARFEAIKITMPGYTCDARLAMNVGMIEHIQAEALAACIESDAKILEGEEVNRGRRRQEFWRRA